MSNEKYAGWTNRETWLVGLHWGNVIEAEMIQDESPQNNAERIGDYVWEMMNSDLPELSPFRDFIDLDIINWLELAEHYLKKKF